LQSLGIAHSLNNDPVSRSRWNRTGNWSALEQNKFIAHGCAMNLSLPQRAISKFFRLAFFGKNLGGSWVSK
jgi:hypothetical protein